MELNKIYQTMSIFNAFKTIFKHFILKHYYMKHHFKHAICLILTELTIFKSDKTTETITPFGILY